MDLAIVIPYYKKEFFRSCLGSLSRQTNKNFKVYIGNDGSKEDPEKLINTYAEKLEIEYCSFPENLGQRSLVAHWNRILEKVRNESWIMILGDDDVLGENCVESFYQSLPKIEKFKISVVRFATHKINSNNQIISPVYEHPQVENSIDFLFRKLNEETRSSLSEYIFKKDCIEKVGFKGFPLAWHTDDLLILECSDFGNVFTINKAKVYFRVSEINISSIGTNLIRKNKASFLFFKYLLKSHNFKFSVPQKKVLYQKLLYCYNNNKLNLNLLFSTVWITIHFNYYLKFFQFWKDIIRDRVLNSNLNLMDGE